MALSTNIEAYADWRDYYELTKPRVVMLIVFTAIVGMFLSVPGWPDPGALIFGTLGIGLAAVFDPRHVFRWSVVASAGWLVAIPLRVAWWPTDRLADVSAVSFGDGWMR